MPRKISTEELEELLSASIDPLLDENSLEEDLLIEQPDGSRACLNWELRGQGYQIIDTNRQKRNY
jgi:hypothetical protein